MTYIYQEVNKNDFVDAFTDMNRAEKFSYHAKLALYNYYSELAESSAEPIELDIIAICCDWTEYNDMEEVEQYYSQISDLEGDDKMNWLEDRTTVIKVSGTSYKTGKPVQVESILMMNF